MVFGHSGLRTAEVQARGNMIDKLTLDQRSILERINFLCIGTQKAGTTWLDAMLRQHPDVFIPASKELHFFSNNTIYQKGLGWYCDQFSDVGAETCVGECTPNYIRTVFAPNEMNSVISAQVPHRIQKVLPNVKLLVSLRDPVDRAISAYYHFVTRGDLSPRKRLRDVMHMKGVAAFGRYSENLQAWFECFEPDRFQILVYEEDIRPDLQKPKTMSSVFRFLGVDDQFTPAEKTAPQNTRQSNVGAFLNQLPLVRKYQIGRDLVGWVSTQMPESLEPLFNIPIEQADRDALVELFAPQQMELEALLGRKMPWGYSNGQADASPVPSASATPDV